MKVAEEIRRSFLEEVAFELQRELCAQRHRGVISIVGGGMSRDVAEKRRGVQTAKPLPGTDLILWALGSHGWFPGRGMSIFLK